MDLIVCGDALWISCGTWTQLWSGTIGALTSAILAAGVALLVVWLTNKHQSKLAARAVAAQKEIAADALRDQMKRADEAHAAQEASMRVQLDHADRSEKIRNTFELIKYLEEPQHLEARRTMGPLAKKEFADWTDEERNAGEMVSGMWEVGATIHSIEALPDSFLSSLYGGAIVRHWNLLRPLVMEIRARSGENDQRQKFEHLAVQLGRSGLACEVLSRDEVEE